MQFSDSFAQNRTFKNQEDSMTKLCVVSAREIRDGADRMTQVQFLDGHYVYLEMGLKYDGSGKLLQLSIFHDLTIVFRYASRLNDAAVEYANARFTQQTAAAYFEAAQEYLIQDDPLAPAFPRTLCEETMQLLERMKAGELEVLPPVDFKSMSS